MAEKEIVNKTTKQRLVNFKDGSSVALKRGQKITTSRDVKTKEKGVEVREVSAQKASTKGTTKASGTKTSSSTASSNTNTSGSLGISSETKQENNSE